MQTYTHAAIGAAVGAMLFPNNFVLQGACAAGAMAPDLVMVPQYLIDVAAGRKPMTVQSKRFILIKELSHSLPLWAITAAVCMLLAVQLWPGFFTAILWAGAVGGLSHLPIDVLTHTSPRFAKEDLGMLWPFKTRLQVGGWDYRKDYGNLTPKPFEVFVLVASLLFFVCRQI